jgi:hypothetical protein
MAISFELSIKITLKLTDDWCSLCGEYAGFLKLIVSMYDGLVQLGSVETIGGKF